MCDFDEIVQKFRDKKLNVSKWNFCICIDKKDVEYSAYIMGEGAEQCLACKHGFNNKQEIEDLYRSLGVKYILPI